MGPDFTEVGHKGSLKGIGQSYLQSNYPFFLVYHDVNSMSYSHCHNWLYHTYPNTIIFNHSEIKSQQKLYLS